MVSDSLSELDSIRRRGLIAMREVPARDAAVGGPDRPCATAVERMEIRPPNVQ
jgi:hypothetical protein